MGPGKGGCGFDQTFWWVMALTMMQVLWDAETDPAFSPGAMAFQSILSPKGLWATPLPALLPDSSGGVEAQAPSLVLLASLCSDCCPN